MSVSVIDLFEVVEIDEQDRELVAVASRAVNLGFQSLVEMTGVIEPGAVIGDGKFLNLFHGARVFNGDGGVIANRLQEKRFLVGEVFHLYVDQLNDAQNPELRP